MRPPFVGAGLTAALVAALVAGTGVRDLRAQDIDPLCSEGSEDGVVGTAELPGGVRVSVRAATDPDAYAEDYCSIKVVGADGTVLWGASGFRAGVHPWNGRDVDGDGRPDAVLMVDTGGGNVCCQTFHVFRLSPAWTPLATLPYWPEFAHVDGEPPLVWHLKPFYHLGRCMACAPLIVLVDQWRGDRFGDVTPTQCAEIFAGESPWGDWPVKQFEEWAAPERLAAARRAPAGPLPDEASGVEDTRTAATALALQNLACGTPEAARRLVDAAWPPAAATERWERVREAFTDFTSRRPRAPAGSNAPARGGSRTPG